MSDSLELVNFAIGLVKSVLNLHNGQVMFFSFFWQGGGGGWESNHRNTVRQIQNSCGMKAVFQAAPHSPVIFCIYVVIIIIFFILGTRAVRKVEPNGCRRCFRVIIITIH